VVKLTIKRQKFYYRRCDKLNSYGMSVSHIITAMFRLSYSITRPLLVQNISAGINMSNTKGSIVEQELFTLPMHLSSFSISVGFHA
jgi:hypothetical protein